MLKNICIVGLGNMGQAIFNALSIKKSFRIEGCEKADDINKKLSVCDIFIIAVKPQSFEELVRSISVDLSEKLAISIMAGVSISNIQKKLNIKKVVRVMPNLPLKVGEAMTGWCPSKEVSDEEKNFVKDILRSFGEEVFVKSEDQIDMVTALSGSGPAYFYLLTELLEKAALEMGFQLVDAKKIALSTFSGSASLLKKLDEIPKILREKVTSKGGTTEAAINYLEKNKFDKIFIEAVKSAYKRAKELNKK